MHLSTTGPPVHELAPYGHPEKPEKRQRFPCHGLRSSHPRAHARASPYVPVTSIVATSANRHDWASRRTRGLRHESALSWTESNPVSGTSSHTWQLMQMTSPLLESSSGANRNSYARM